MLEIEAILTTAVARASSSSSGPLALASVGAKLLTMESGARYLVVDYEFRVRASSGSSRLELADA